MKDIYKYMLILLGTAGFAQNSPIFGGGIGDGWHVANHVQWTNNIYEGGYGDGWSMDKSLFTTLAVEHQDFFKSTVAFPNPTSGVLQIRLTQPVSIMNVEVIDLAGRVIQKREFQDSELFTILIEGSSGIYLVRISAEGSEATYKIVKN